MRVTCSDGTVGWGECFGSSGTIVVAAFDKWVRYLAVGKDPDRPNLIPGSSACSTGSAAPAR